jgi:hypothetical protein
MVKVKIFNISLLILVSTLTGVAQKAPKYKDIYALLSVKQYDQAEPFLKAYLKENAENPNAYLFMGLIYQEKSLTTDVLVHTDRCIQQMDSGIIHLTKAAQMITEKELKKNDEYYTMYNRRDLRTGTFGVKLSDVQLDIESRISSLRERIDKVKMVKFYFTQTESLYSRSQELFKEIQKTVPGQKELYLRADEAMISKVKSLSLRFDSCTKMFENYKSSLSSLGRTKYNQSWTLQEIVNFKQDGTERADFYKDDIKAWDYKKFANHTVTVIEKEVLPTLEDLVKYDIEINKLRNRLETDSVSVKNDLVKLIDRLLNNQLKKFDDSPMPMDVFALKIADLDSRSTVIENKAVKKSDDISAKAAALSKELYYLKKVDSLALKVLSRNLDEDIVNYHRFITATYNSGEVLKSYVKGLKDLTDRETAKKTMELANLLESEKWLIAASDSIPLLLDYAQSKFKPLLVEENKYTVGTFMGDDGKGNGYFYNITPSHIPTIKATFALDTSLVKKPLADNLRGMAVSDAGEQIYFTMISSTAANANAKYVTTVAKIYRSDGLSWNVTAELTFMPTKILFIAETGELLIKSEGEESISVDKNGKLIQR